MTQEHKYYTCEICGSAYDNAEDATQHEKEHPTKIELKKIHHRKNFSQAPFTVEIEMTYESGEKTTLTYQIAERIKFVKRY